MVWMCVSVYVGGELLSHPGCIPALHPVWDRLRIITADQDEVINQDECVKNSKLILQQGW